MSKVSLTKEVSVSMKDFYAVVTDYERYPEFISEIKKAKVISEKPKRVEFTLELMKTFHYVLEMKEKSPSEVSWTLVESNLFTNWHYRLGIGRIFGEIYTTYTSTSSSRIAHKYIINRTRYVARDHFNKFRGSYSWKRSHTLRQKL